jgi:hypothetical protein
VGFGVDMAESSAWVGEAVRKTPKISKIDGILQSQIERMSIVGWGNL